MEVNIINCQNKCIAFNELHDFSTGHVDAAKILIEHGANLNLENLDSETALYTAARLGVTKILHFES